MAYLAYTGNSHPGAAGADAHVLIAAGIGRGQVPVGWTCCGRCAGLAACYCCRFA